MEQAFSATAWSPPFAMEERFEVALEARARAGTRPLATNGPAFVTLTRPSVPLPPGDRGASEGAAAGAPRARRPRTLQARGRVVDKLTREAQLMGPGERRGELRPCKCDPVRGSPPCTGSGRTNRT